MTSRKVISEGMLLVIARKFFKEPEAGRSADVYCKRERLYGRSAELGVAFGARQ
jgi:hypothetical protein